MSKSSKILLFLTILGVILSLGIIAISLVDTNNSTQTIQTQNAPF